MPNKLCGRAILPKDAAPITDNIPDEPLREAMVPDPATGVTPEPTGTKEAQPGLLGSAWNSVSGAVSNVWDSLAATTADATSLAAAAPSGLVKEASQDDPDSMINTPEMAAAAVAGGVADR